jgi:hypothetical protein
VREIRMLRAMWRALETGLRNLLTGHEGGNAGHRQGVSFESPRQCSTLPGSDAKLGAGDLRYRLWRLHNIAHVKNSELC